MPRTGPRRPIVAVRLSEAGITTIDRLATQAGLLRGDGQPNRSEMIRILLAEAVKARQQRPRRRGAGD